MAEHDETVGMIDAHSRAVPDMTTGPGGRLLAATVTLSAVCCLAVAIIWAALGAGRFWPMWVWLGFGAPLALLLSLRRALSEPEGPPRERAVHTALASVLSAVVILVWLMAGGRVLLAGVPGDRPVRIAGRPHHAGVACGNRISLPASTS